MSSEPHTNNRIQRIEVIDHSLIPAEAEVRIAVVPERQTGTTEVRGRLMGPRCPFSNTVEVAYPLRPTPGITGLTVRAVIPEACLWEPESPFLYQEPLELWQDGQRCDRRALSHGLRSISLDERGLRVNGRPLTLHGRTVADCSEEDALALRRQGCNLLVVPVRAETLSIWEVADRLGFFVLGQVTDDSEQTRSHLEMLSHRASCLGWLIEDGTHPTFPILPKKGLIGLACVDQPSSLALSIVHFLFGSPALVNLGRPLLVKGDVPVAPPIFGSVV